MTIPSRCDVVVIGGGPAGSLAAAHLARAGYEVVQFEKQRHPRNTVGESLIPDFWKYFDDIGVTEKIEAEGFVKKAGGVVDWHGETRSLSFKDFGYTRPALHVERDRLDQILFEHARTLGVRSYEQVAVLAVELDTPEGTRVNYRPVAEGGVSAFITCRFVIDASGQNALLARQLGVRVMDKEFRFMSVWGYFANSKYVAADQQVYPASSLRTVPPTTYVTSLPHTGEWGWCWHILLRDSASVGLVLPLDAMRSVKERGMPWDAYLREQCLLLPRMRTLLADATLIAGSVSAIRDFSYQSERVAGPGFFIVGDAAGFVDPIFSVGFVLAMYSARAAAWWIDRSFRYPERAEEYQRIYTNLLQNGMQLARALALPKYEIGDAATRGAREALGFADANERALIEAASRLTERSRHFEALNASMLSAFSSPRSR